MEEAPGAKRPGARLSGRVENRQCDLALMERVREGHREALRSLCERYWSPLVAYAEGIVEGRDEAKDVVQNVFIRVWQKRQDWTPTGSVSAYLYHITRNLSLNARRDLRTRKRHDESTGLKLAETPCPTPVETLEADALRAEVQAAIDVLPERRREVFVLSCFHGLKHREIAETMGISTQTVANQMSAALAELRKRLACRLAE